MSATLRPTSLRALELASRRRALREGIDAVSDANRRRAPLIAVAASEDDDELAAPRSRRGALHAHELRALLAVADVHDAAREVLGELALDRESAASGDEAQGRPERAF